MWGQKNNRDNERRKTTKGSGLPGAQINGLYPRRIQSLPETIVYKIQRSFFRLPNKNIQNTTMLNRHVIAQRTCGKQQNDQGGETVLVVQNSQRYLIKMRRVHPLQNGR